MVTTRDPLKTNETAEFPEVQEVTGALPGPVLTILGGIHGDELEGVLAARRIAAQLDPATLRGTVRIVAPAHPAAWKAVSRESPIDGLNLARVFPGDAGGSPTEQVAHFISNTAIAGSDMLIDLHSAGESFDMPLMVGYHAGSDTVSSRAALAASAFAAPYVWLHPEIAPGRSLAVAEALGIPSIYVEGRGGGQVQLADLNCYVEGALRVMQSLGMIPSAPPAQPSLQVSGDGNTDAGISSPATGFFVNAVGVGDEVPAGGLLGKILNEQGMTIARVHASGPGIVMLVRRRSRVRTGEITAIVADRVSSGEPKQEEEAANV